jgi:hypothetical protein
MVGMATLGLAPTSRAGDPFTLTARTTGGTPQTITASGSSAPDLANDVVQTQSKFQVLQGQPFTASLRYGGLQNAVTYSQDAAGTTGTVRIPSIGLTKTFNTSSESGLRDQIRDYFTANGADDYARFIRQVDRKTLLGVADGNPLATTALLSDLPYKEFGLNRPALRVEDAGPEQVQGGLRLALEGGFADTDDGNGYFASGILSSHFRFTDRIGLVLATKFTYVDFDGSSVYHLGGEVALPILIIPSHGDGTLSWQVTPEFLAAASGSLDLAAGGTFLGGGVTSGLSYQTGPFTFTMGNQIAFFEGYPIHVGDFDFKTDVSQQVLKNGLQVRYALNRNAYLDASFTYTNFLQDAAVQDFYSPSAGLTLRFGQTGGLRIAYEGDYGAGFRTNGGSVQFYFNY